MGTLICDVDEVLADDPLGLKGKKWRRFLLYNLP